MPTPTDRLTTIAQRSIDATTTAVRTWTESAQAYAGSFSPEHPLPRATDLHAAAGAWFTLAERLLAEQREFATAQIDAGLQAGTTLADQARAAATAFRPVAAEASTDGKKKT